MKVIYENFMALDVVDDIENILDNYLWISIYDLVEDLKSHNIEVDAKGYNFVDIVYHDMFIRLLLKHQSDRYVQIGGYEHL